MSFTLVRLAVFALLYVLTISHFSIVADATRQAKCTCSPECKNGGECISENTCKCKAGFTGATCEIESVGLCNDTQTYQKNPIFSINFGSGSDQYSQATPSDFNFTTTYQQAFAPITADGNFSFINSVHDDYFGTWHTGALDHTPDDIGGYMFLVNANFEPGQFYNGTVNNLSIGRRHEFSVYVANLMTVPAIEPNILFEVRSPAQDNLLLAQLATGNISASNPMTWSKYGLSFTALSDSVTLLMISNTPGGQGNDLAIDDIPFRVCTPQVSDSGPSAKPMQRPCKPVQFDSDRDHRIAVADDKTLTGTITINSCPSSRFIQNPTRCSSVAAKLTSLLNVGLSTVGFHDQYNVDIVNASGNATCTKFQYRVPCDKALQPTVTTWLKNACIDKDFSDTITKVKQPNSDDLDSECIEGFKT